MEGQKKVLIVVIVNFQNSTILPSIMGGGTPKLRLCTALNKKTLSRFGHSL